jgi:3-deoxy-D-manno-octulosonate 8-phosphate phosphatase (KDO 8-P phosphatase)
MGEREATGNEAGLTPAMAAARSNYDPLLLEKAGRIRLLALDVDGVLTDGKLYFDNSGNELKAFCTRDGLGMKGLQQFGIRLAIITGRTSTIVTRRAEELGVNFVYQGQSDKLDTFHLMLRESGVEAAEICYAGDDWVDIPLLDRAGLAVTVADADPLVKTRVHWVTTLSGGHGAVREICDLILHAQGHDQALLESILNP